MSLGSVLGRLAPMFARMNMRLLCKAVKHKRTMKIRMQAYGGSVRNT